MIENLIDGQGIVTDIPMKVGLHLDNDDEDLVIKVKPNGRDLDKRFYTFNKIAALIRLDKIQKEFDVEGIYESKIMPSASARLSKVDLPYVLFVREELETGSFNFYINEGSQFDQFVKDYKELDKLGKGSVRALIEVDRPFLGKAHQELSKEWDAVYSNIQDFLKFASKY